MSQMLDPDLQAEAATEAAGGPAGDRGPVPGDDGEAVLVPFVVPYEQMNDVLVSVHEIWTYLSLEDRAATLAATVEHQPEGAYLLESRPITKKAERVVDFMRTIAQNLTANIRAEPMTVFELVRDSYDRAKRKGFWNDMPVASGEGVQAKINEKLLLTVSELTEAMEEIRKDHHPLEIYYDEHRPDKPEGFSIELADAMIRIADLAGWLDIDLTAAIRMKAAYNESRPHKHGKQF